jgi:hypothetical protein
MPAGRTRRPAGRNDCPANDGACQTGRIAGGTRGSPGCVAVRRGVAGRLTGGLARRQPGRRQRHAAAQAGRAARADRRSEGFGE